MISDGQAETWYNLLEKRDELKGESCIYQIQVQHRRLLLSQD